MAHQTVVVGYDGSSNADRAVDAAADLAATGGTVHVVTAYHPEQAASIMQSLSQLPEEYRYVWDPDDAERQRQQAALVHLRGRGVDCQGHVVADDAASAILDVALSEGAISSSSAVEDSVGCNGSSAAACPPGSLRTPRPACWSCTTPTR